MSFSDDLQASLELNIGWCFLTLIRTLDTGLLESTLRTAKITDSPFSTYAPPLHPFLRQILCDPRAYAYAQIIATKRTKIFAETVQTKVGILLVSPSWNLLSVSYCPVYKLRFQVLFVSILALVVTLDVGLTHNMVVVLQNHTGLSFLNLDSSWQPVMDFKAAYILPNWTLHIADFECRTSMNSTEKALINGPNGDVNLASKSRYALARRIESLSSSNRYTTTKDNYLNIPNSSH